MKGRKSPSRRDVSALLIVLVVSSLGMSSISAARAETAVERYRFNNTVVYSTFFRNTSPGKEEGRFFSGEAVPITYRTERGAVRPVAMVTMRNLKTVEPTAQVLVDGTLTATSRWWTYSFSDWSQLPGVPLARAFDGDAIDGGRERNASLRLRIHHHGGVHVLGVHRR